MFLAHLFINDDGIQQIPAPNLLHKRGVQVLLKLHRSVRKALVNENRVVITTAQPRGFLMIVNKISFLLAKTDNCNRVPILAQIVASIFMTRGLVPFPT